MPLVQGRTTDDWAAEFLLLTSILAARPVFWSNPRRKPFAEAAAYLPFERGEAEEA